VAKAPVVVKYVIKSLHNAEKASWSVHPIRDKVPRPLDGADLGSTPGNPGSSKFQQTSCLASVTTRVANTLLTGAIRQP
jgi:hypothetical protein